MNVLKVLNCSSLIFRSLYNSPQGLPSIYGLSVSPSRKFSSLQNVFTLALNNSKSFTALIVPSCGMKSKGRLQLRCKDCYYERRDGEMFVFCSSYGRHKQHLRTKRNKKFKWILSYAFMSKIRPY